jgi:hypothetical protein
MTKKPAKSKAPAKAKPRSAWQQWVAKAGGIDELCQHIVSGGHMAEFCRARDFAYTTVLSWVNADPTRVELYARAREDRSDKLADEIVAISDEVDVRTKIDGEDVSLALDATAVARNRLRIDARKWVAAKLKPRMYGDKVALGGDPDAPPIRTEGTMTLTADEAYKRMLDGR